jgi:hypothetical protein
LKEEFKVAVVLINRFYRLTAGLACGFLLTFMAQGCHGSGDVTPPAPPIITGIATVGVAIANGVVTVKDQN